MNGTVSSFLLSHLRSAKDDSEQIILNLRETTQPPADPIMQRPALTISWLNSVRRSVSTSAKVLPNGQWRERILAVY